MCWFRRPRCAARLRAIHGATVDGGPRPRVGANAVVTAWDDRQRAQRRYMPPRARRAHARLRLARATTRAILDLDCDDDDDLWGEVV